MLYSRSGNKFINRKVRTNAEPQPKFQVTIRHSKSAAHEKKTVELRTCCKNLQLVLTDTETSEYDIDEDWMSSYF